MKTPKTTRSPLVLALAAALAAPGMALAAGGSGMGGGMSSGFGGGVQTRDRIPSPDQLQTRDQDRLKVHEDTTAAAAGDQDRLQTRLQDMDRTRDQLSRERMQASARNCASNTASRSRTAWTCCRPGRAPPRVPPNSSTCNTWRGIYSRCRKCCNTAGTTRTRRVRPSDGRSRVAARGGRSPSHHAMNIMWPPLAGEERGS